ncbi:hypothetical protein Tco_1476673 [Tanacetum coccineum]
MHTPLQSHFKATLRVLRYLKGSPGCGIQFYNHSNFKLKAYADADWAKCPKTKRSITGFCVFLEKVLAGIIKTVKVSSELPTTDIFTKCHGIVQHRLCCKKLGMLDVFRGELVGKDSGRKKHFLRERKDQAYQPKG